MPALQLTPIDPENAPDAVAATLVDVRTRYGFLANLYRYFAHAPSVLKGYLALSDLFAAGTLSATERNVVLLAVSRENGCRCCVVVHSTIADMQRDDTAITDVDMLADHGWASSSPQDLLCLQRSSRQTFASRI